MTTCPCGQPLTDWPALWLTSTNPSVECCSLECARTSTGDRAAASANVLDAQMRAENDVRTARRRAGL